MVKGKRFVFVFLLAFAFMLGFGQLGSYRNPVLFADYSDPDVIRVGDDYYLVASSFHYMPGVPILKSRDLVNWTIVGHVYPRLDLNPAYDLVGGDHYGGGSWAPAIRYHDGKFFVYFPTPNEGIFMSTAPKAEGPWTKPVAVISGGGLEDPCPFWDDDGTAYLVHSRLGAGPLILHKMSADGTRVLDEGKVIVEDHRALPTLEGPKFYKRNGYYYIWAPYGGVGTGSQAVLRSRSIYGPYEHRTVLSQGATSINGPHQGGYVETPSGEGWFFHFHSEGAYGRIGFLEPVRWMDDWPVVGKDGEPVTEWQKPDVGPRQRPQMSDEFNGKTLGPQWEWNHNPDDSRWSLSARRGFLRLVASPASDLYHARNTLTQAMQGSAFDLTTRIDVSGMRDGQRAGLTMLCDKASGIGVSQVGALRRLVFFAPSGEVAGSELSQNEVLLRVHVDHEKATYSYSLDSGKKFTPLGGSAPIVFSWWKAPRPALYSYGTEGYVDVDWVHVDLSLPPFEADIERFEAEDYKKAPAKGGIVFVGSSSIVRWKTLKEDFPGLNVLNRGFGGSEVADSVRYAQRIVTPYEPRMVVFYAGTNDIANGKTGEKVFGDYRAFVAKVREKLPSVPIAYISIAPSPSRQAKWDQFRKANSLIKDFSASEKGLAFIDIFPLMLDEKGGPRPELFVEDQLHMNPKGYAIWKKAVAPFLTREPTSLGRR